MGIDANICNWKNFRFYDFSSDYNNCHNLNLQDQVIDEYLRSK